MKAFRFALARVLAWRRTQLALEETELERLRSNLRGVEAAISDLGRRDEAETERIRKMQSAPGSDMADLARFRDWVSHEEKTLTLRRIECGRQIEKQSAAVTEARRKVELVERLKDRRRQSWEAEFDLEMEQLAGESALGVWRRGRD